MKTPREEIRILLTGVKVYHNVCIVSFLLFIFVQFRCSCNETLRNNSLGHSSLKTSHQSLFMLFLTLSFHLVIVLGFTFSLNRTTTLPYKLLSSEDPF